MPILAKEPSIYPEDLLERPDTGQEEERCWWAIYTRSRREKDFMRKLLSLEVPFYCPITPQRQRSPSGRIRTSYLPLFTNYVFVYGDVEDRYKAFTTNCISSDLRVKDGVQLTHDLRQFYGLIQRGVKMTRESKLTAGDRVRIKTGPFKDYEGYILERKGETRLVIAVNFLQQGASVQLDDCHVEPL